MGHQQLGAISRSRNWRQVIGLIADGAEVQAVAAAASRAAEASMIDASADPAVRHAFWLLTQVPIAARHKQFASALRRLGLDVGDQPTLVELTARVMNAIDKFVAQSKGRSDFGEMAQLCAAESLTAVTGRELPDLFGNNSMVQAVLAGFATPKQFAVLARDFFARLTRLHLNYFLSRVLLAHIGAGKRFSSVREHRAFEEALEIHCRETSRIIREFSAEWFSKHVFEGGIDEAGAGRFVHVAFQKIRKELQQRRGPHA
jgi:hypothetical protein